MLNSKKTPKVLVIRSLFRPTTFSIHRRAFATVILIGWKLSLVQTASSSIKLSTPEEQTAVSTFINRRLEWKSPVLELSPTS